MASFSAASVIAEPVGATILALVGALGLAAGAVANRSAPLHPLLLAGLLGVLVIVVANGQEMGRFSVQRGSYSIWFALAFATCMASCFSVWRDTRPLTIVLAISTVIASSLLVLLPDWLPKESSDVYGAHRAAGEALANGENPYSESVVFVSGDPFRPDDALVFGYPYTPPALATYAVASNVTDSRVISVISWIATAVGLAVLSRWRNPAGDVTLAVLVLMAVMPIWRMTVFMAWTEPLSVALLGGGLYGICKRRNWGWVLLGLALASKQYFVFAAPLVLLFRDDGGRRPGWLAIGTAGLVTVFPTFLGAEEYVQSIVGNALDIGFRPDSQSLNGAINALGWNWLIPTVAVVPVVAVALYLVGRSADNRTLMARGALVTSIALVFTSAFPNYWLFVSVAAGFAAIILARAVTPEELQAALPVKY
jgi:hypothetical protein